MSSPAYKATLLSLPDAAYIAIVHQLGTLQEIWKFESLHPILKHKLNRLLWGSSQCLMIGTDGFYGSVEPVPVFTRQCSRDSALKSIIRTPGGDTSPRQKYRVRFDLENAVWSYAAPRMKLLTTKTAFPRFVKCVNETPVVYHHWPLCADKPSTSDAFNVFCGYVDGQENINDVANIMPCVDFFKRTHKCLRELHIGPVKQGRSGKALQKFITTLTDSEIALEKLVLTFDDESELFCDRPPSINGTRHNSSPTRSLGFPSRTVQCKLMQMVKRQGNSLNSVQIYLNEEFSHWMSVKRTTVDDVCTVDLEFKYKNSCPNTQFTLHCYADAFKYENRTLATRTNAKLWSKLKDLINTITFCMTSGISFECRKSMRYLNIEIYLDDDDDDDDMNTPDVAKRREVSEEERGKKLAECLKKVFLTEDLVPYMLRQMERIEWSFVNVELSLKDFQEVCSIVQPFRDAITVVKIGSQQKFIAAASILEQNPDALKNVV